MWTVIKGETRELIMEVSRKSAGNFDIATAEYDVEGIQSGACSIDNVDKQVSFFIETAAAGFEAGHRYMVEFTVTIAGLTKIIKGRSSVYIQ